MFAFESLEVYKKVKSFNYTILEILEDKRLKPFVRDQLGRAALSIQLNIAEGSSRFSNRDKRRFLEISRGSAFECASLLEYLLERNVVTSAEHANLYAHLEEISKMLYTLMKKLK